MDNKINFETFANGALAERMNDALKEVIENIADPNTPSSFKRKLTLEMKFMTNEDRQISEVQIVAKPKLAPKETITTTILIDRTLEGEVLATEIKKQIPGQTFMKVDAETGEILSSEKEKVEEDISGLQIIK